MLSSNVNVPLSNDETGADVLNNRGGRPRDLAAGAAVLRAAYDILTEAGLASLTIEAVSKRAGVGRPMIYRRWNNSGALAVACFRERVLPDLTVIRSGDVIADLASFMERSIAVMETPAGRIFAAIVGEAQHDLNTFKALKGDYLDRRTSELVVLLEDGKAAGLFERSLNNEVAISMILGMILHQLMLIGRFDKEFLHLSIQMLYRAFGTKKLVRKLAKFA